MGNPGAQGCGAKRRAGSRLQADNVQHGKHRGGKTLRVLALSLTTCMLPCEAKKKVVSKAFFEVERFLFFLSLVFSLCHGLG